MKALGLFLFLIIFLFAEQANSQEIEATLAGATQSDGFSVKAGGSTLFRVRGDGNVGIGTTTPSATLQVVGTTKIGTSTDVVSISEIIELSGTTASSGDVTHVSYPSGWSKTNTRIISCEIKMTNTRWIGNGFYIGNSGNHTFSYLCETDIQLFYDHNSSYQNVPYRLILMKVN